MRRKSLFAWIALLFLLVMCSQCNIHTVGDRPEDYESIQQAIDSSSEGDVISVSSGIYWENLVIDRRLKLIGLENPVIDAGGEYALGPAVTITADGVVIEGFEVSNSTNIAGDPQAGAGIEIRSNHNIIKSNLIENNFRSGIKILRGYNNTVINNTIRYNYEGILIAESHRNSVIGNNISGNLGSGISLIRDSGENEIMENVITNNSRGISIDKAGYNDIERNSLWGNLVKNIELILAPLMTY